MLNNPDKFCYICAEVTFASRKFSVTWTIKEAYLLYFGCKVGHQNNKWAPHVCYTTCSSKLNAWVNGKDVVCRLECPWFGGCIATTVLTVISVWYTLFQIVCPWKKSIKKSEKASAMTFSGNWNFQKTRQNFWHQVYNSGIYYNIPWKWQYFAPETKNSGNSLKPRFSQLLQRHWWPDGWNAYQAQSWAVATIHWCFTEQS